jgi:ADP-ribose pyrophosphatase YjhB (NUDIX family)
MKEENKFEVIILGIIFDPKTKKVLIGKREKDKLIPELKWCFPGGRASNKEDVDKTLKSKIKKKTGYKIKNLGTIFSRTYPEKPNLLAVYFLTQVFEGKEKPGDDIKELKWVSPKELEKYFPTSLNKKLKEFLVDLV